MIGHGLFESEPIRSVFYLHAAIFEIPVQRFNRDQLLLLFIIISMLQTKTCYLTFPLVKNKSRIQWLNLFLSKQCDMNSLGVYLKSFVIFNLYK